MKVTKLQTLLVCFIVCLSVVGGRELKKRQAGNPFGFPAFPFGPSSGQSHPSYGGNYQNFFNDFPFPTFGPYSYTTPPPKQDMCVPPPDQSAIYKISSTMTAYPLTEIQQELNTRPEMQILVNNAIPISTSDSLTVDDSYTCPSKMMRLVGFWMFNNQCWVLQDFHDIKYAVCTQPYCQGCTSSNTRYSRSMCWNHYEKIHVWAYCSAANLGQRIARVQIVIPKYCACKKVKCY